MSETEPIEKTDIPIQSPYKDVPVGGILRLYDGPICLKDNGGEVTGPGSIDLSLQGHPAIRYNLSYNFPPSIKAARPELTIPASHTATPTLTLLLNSRFTYSEGTATQSGILQGDGLTIRELNDDGEQEPIGRIKFHLINFFAYIGTPIKELQDGEPHTWSGRVTFPIGPWVVTLDQFRDTEDRLVEATATNGFALTHIGELRKKDDELFSPEDGSKVLEALYWLLSFINGSRCGIALPVGLQHQNDPLWQHWYLWKASLPQSDYNWFSYAAGIKCFEVADLFYQCWQDATRQDWLKSAVGFYIASNRNTDGIDLALANSQITLEMLTWVALMEENSLMSGASFERLSAARKIKELLSWLGVSQSSPPQFQHLKKAAGNSDAPQTAVAIRNLVIHQTQANRKKRVAITNELYGEAWYLNLWYIELTLLKLLGYSGPYYNRTGLPQGQLWDTLPWAK